MMNKIDAEQIAVKVTDQLRVKTAHHGVTMNDGDLLAFRNFLEQTLSKYTDNRHILDRGPGNESH